MESIWGETDGIKPRLERNSNRFDKQNRRARFGKSVPLWAVWTTSLPSLKRSNIPKLIPNQMRNKKDFPSQSAPPLRLTSLKFEATQKVGQTNAQSGTQRRITELYCTCPRALCCVHTLLLRWTRARLNPRENIGDEEKSQRKFNEDISTQPHMRA